MAVTDISIPLQYIKSGTLAQRPTSGQFNGQIYYATDTDASYQWTGSSWLSTSVDLTGLADQTAENALEILELQVASLITPDTQANLAEDYFSDVDGYKNSINTGSTTAYLSNNSYSNGITITNNTMGTLNNTNSYTATNGYKIKATANCLLSTITTSSTTTANRWLLLNSSKATIASGTITSHVGTINRNLVSGTTYYVVVDSSGSSYNGSYETTGTYPSAQTNITFIACVGNGTDSTGIRRAIDTITTIAVGTTGADKIIQTNTLTLPLTPSKFLIFPYRKYTTGTGSITADISFDGGSHYQTGVAINTITNITYAGTSLILKINLNAGASSGIASCAGYGVLFW